MICTIGSYRRLFLGSLRIRYRRAADIRSFASPFVIPSFLHPNSILSQVDYANAAGGGSPCSTSPGGGGGGNGFNGGGISRIAAAAAASEASNAMFVQQQQHEQSGINSQQQQQVGDLPDPIRKEMIKIRISPLPLDGCMNLLSRGFVFVTDRVTEAGGAVFNLVITALDHMVILI